MALPPLPLSKHYSFYFVGSRLTVHRRRAGEWKTFDVALRVGETYAWRDGLVDYTLTLDAVYDQPAEELQAPSDDGWPAPIGGPARISGRFLFTRRNRLWGRRRSENVDFLC